MNNFSGFSTIIALSKQLETITALQKATNPLQLSEGALSAIQQISSLSTIQGINPDISAIADQMSVLSKLDISALTSGITIGTDTVKITRQAKETLDSLHEQFASINNSSEDSSPDEAPPASPAETEQNTAQNVPDESEAEADSSLSSDPLPAEDNSADIYELSVPDFKEKYYAVLEKLIFALLVPFMIAYIFRTDFTPLTDAVSSWCEKYISIETQKLNTEQEHNELHKQQLEADQKRNELFERQLEIDQERNELLKQQLETDYKCPLYKEPVDSKP